MRFSPLPRLLLLSALLGAPALAAAAAPAMTVDSGGPTSFREVWAYLMRGEESALSGSEPVTDVCYFSARLNRDGRLDGTVRRPAVTMDGGRQPAVHLVIAEVSNDVLLHLALDPRFGVRPLLIADIVKASDGFDGVQIDFETVPREDADDFVEFLRRLKQALPASRVLSVALPARTRQIADAYDYTRIAPIVDRVIVMAYDEHWSGSEPGPVASLAWCTRVADYASSVVPAGHLVMGLPLYGRAWQDKTLARALRWTNVQDLITTKGSAAVTSADQGATFAYSETVVVTVYFDDERSLQEKLRMYGSRGVTAVSFWRLGLGPAGMWSGITVEQPPIPRDALARLAPAL